jgi:hypothetical protein
VITPREGLRRVMNRVNDLPDPSPRGGAVMMWLGHNLLPLMTVWAAFAVPDDLLGNPGGWVQWLGGAVTALYLAVFWSEIRWHRKRLCEKCASKTPLDPQAQAARWRQGLRAVHLLERYIAVWLLAWLALSFIGSSIWADIVSALFALVVLLLWVCLHMHDRLQPWCPWCDWGKGGDEEASPEVPDPALSK